MMNMARDRVETDERLHDLSQKYLSEKEEKQLSNTAATLAHDPKMLITVYDVSEALASALAGAIETGNIDKLAALISWDIENYLDDNGGIESWLN